MPSQALIVLSGLPGSGKSTLAENLSRRLLMPVFSVDPIEAAMWRGGIAKHQTGIAAYEIAIAMADQHLELGHSVISTRSIPSKSRVRPGETSPQNIRI